MSMYKFKNGAKTLNRSFTSNGMSVKDWGRVFKDVKDYDNILDKIVYYIEPTVGKDYKAKIIKPNQDMRKLVTANERARILKLSDFNPESLCIIAKDFFESPFLEGGIHALFLNVSQIKGVVCLLKSEKEKIVTEFNKELIEINELQAPAYLYKK